MYTALKSSTLRHIVLAPEEYFPATMQCSYRWKRCTVTCIQVEQGGFRFMGFPLEGAASPCETSPIYGDGMQDAINMTEAVRHELNRQLRAIKALKDPRPAPAI